MATQSWLSQFAAISGGDFEVSPQLDREISRQAVLARRDRDARDKLFGLLSFKIWRYCLRYHGFNLDPWEFGDVQQLSYLVFVQLVERWRPELDTRPSGFLTHFFAIYPLRLADEVRRLRGTRRGPLTGGVEENPQPDEREVQLIQSIISRLDARERKLLLLRIKEDLPVIEAAERVGMTHRTAYRRWSDIMKIGREELRDAG